MARSVTWRDLWWIAGLILVLVLVGVVVLVNRRAGETLKRHRETYQAEQAALDLVERGRAAILLPALEGSAEATADRYVAAVEAIPAEERDRLSRTAVEGEDEDEDEDTSTPEEQDRILAAHPEPLAVLAEILRVPSRPQLPRLDDARDVYSYERALTTDWASAAQRRAIVRGDVPAALRLAGELVAFGMDGERNGTALSSLLGATVAGLALGPVRAILRDRPVAPADARELARVLDVLDAVRPRSEDLLRIEHARMRGLWSSRDLDIETEIADVGWQHLWSRKVWRAAGLDEGDRVVPEIDAAVRLGDTDARRGGTDLEAVTARIESPIPRLHFVVWGSILRKRAACAAEWRVTRTALALSLHVAEKGEPPASLEALVPAYLPSVPVDPWDGRPLRYDAGPPARVWSVGRDGRDDGGAPPAKDADDAEAPDLAITLAAPR